MSLLARPRILVSGFGAFPGMPENPTSDLVRSLPRRLMGLKVHRRVFPVSWERSPKQVQRSVETVVPHLLLMLGVARQDCTGRLELQATNRLDGRPDGDGQLLLPGPIVPIRPMSHTLNCHWPCEDLVQKMRRRGHDLELSKDAGRYLCNRSYYGAFEAPTTAGVGFLHVAPGAYSGLSDPRRKLVCDLIRALDLWLRT
jgi:pyroglutamyl-peptidase